ncbi:MAG: hypothetical protein ABIC04_08305 [Nanoarchaeota archaeon]
MKLKEIKNTMYFTKGHRGYLYLGEYKNKKVIIKTKRQESNAIGRIENEANFLKLLNNKKIGPNFLYYDQKKDFLVYEYVEGEFFPIFLEHSNIKNMIIKVITKVIMQCYKMDKLKINKEEMHHPYKHIIIPKNKQPVMLDFERCHYAKESINVTQFSSYLISNFMTDSLSRKGVKIDREKMITAAKTYKKEVNKKNLDRIISLIKP